MAYPRSLFVRRTSESRSNRPMKDMMHWIMYEELRFVLSGDQLESELQHDLNAFLGKFKHINSVSRIHIMYFSSTRVR